MGQPASTAKPKTILRAADFVSSLGVNTKIGQAGNSPDAIISDLAYLGLSNVRNVEIKADAPAPALANYGKLADAGIKFDWLTGGAKVSTTAALKANLAALDTFLKAHPGSITAIEGPNEINNFPITFNGLSGVAAAQSYQQALDSAVKADKLTADIPVLNFTNSAPTVGASDAMNAHPYPNLGVEPLAHLTEVVKKQAAAAPGKALYLTEAGYSSLVGMHGREGVDETTQAKLTLNLLMDATSLGVSRTYLYDLVDDGADPTGTISADHLGLFTTTGRAKPVATAIHNLTSILADTGAGAATFTPTALNFTLSGLPATGSSLVVEKSSGVYDIVIWAEPTIWDATRHIAVAAPSTTVNLSLGGGVAKLAVFDPLVSAGAIQTVANTGSIGVSVTDHPLIVEVSALTQAMAGVVGGSGGLSAPAASMQPPLTYATSSLAANTAH